MLIFGKNVCKIYFETGKKIETLYLQKGFNDKNINSLIEKRNLNIKFLSKNEMDDLVNGNHQGIIANVSNYQYAKLDSILGKNKKVVILDHLEDPHNLGAIIRTAEAAGIDGVIIPKDRAVNINGTVAKISVGTIYQIPIIMVTNIADTVDYLKNNDFWIVGTSLTADVFYDELPDFNNIALVIGNEGKGISNLVSKKCDVMTKIPMYGRTNSLNASVAAGLLIYEIVRNRK